MSDHAEHEDLNALILAAEDCAPEQFEQLHSFSAYEERILRSLIAHGPVLLRGGRGSGKSALLIEASRRLAHHDHAIGLYVTLRHLPLLRSEGAEYERIFCKLVSEHTQHQLTQAGLVDGPPPYCGDTGALREWLRNLAMRYQRRIVLIFDDAAHIGRETALTEFFDIFRMLSCDLVACKAAIYPGVTKFGVRFDVFNDATVLDLARDERSAAFKDFFEDVLVKRY
ncbi:MAG: ATP-binding protein, partial [Chloroflexia bacterium]|nr:ATP-binding protein [Chloroflexia bacterium]